MNQITCVYVYAYTCILIEQTLYTYRNIISFRNTLYCMQDILHGFKPETCQLHNTALTTGICTFLINLMSHIYLEELNEGRYRAQPRFSTLYGWFRT